MPFFPTAFIVGAAVIAGVIWMAAVVVVEELFGDDI